MHMELIPHYQRIMDLNNKSTFAYEVTVKGYLQGRWIGAESILNVISQRSSTPNFDKQVHASALRHAPKPDSLLFLNCEQETLLTRQLEFPEGTDFSKIVLEVNERFPINEHIKQIAETLMPFREQGMKIAIDDFGVGWSNFVNVAILTPEFIKLDKSITEQLHTNVQLQVFFTGLLKFSEEINAEIIAEGVETEEQNHFLSEHHIPFAQGYFYDIPRPTYLAQMSRS